MTVMRSGVEIDRRTTLRDLGAGLGLLALFGAAVLVAGRLTWVTGGGGGAGAEGTVENLGSELFRRWLLPFELTALLLIIAAVGTIALGLFRRGEEPPGDEEVAA